MEFLDTFDSRPVLLSEVDFDWVAQCDNASHLRSAILQLENEHYPELLQACRARLDQVEPSNETIIKQQTQQQQDAILSQINNSLAECQTKEQELLNQLKNTSINSSAHLPPVRSASTGQTASTTTKKSCTPAEYTLLYQRAKAQGNESYRAVELEAALKFYRQAVEYRDLAGLSDSTIETNMAITCIKLKRFDQALDHCSHVLRTDSNNWKALWRRAQALEGLSQFEEALATYKSAQSLCTDSAKKNDIAKDLSRCQKRLLEPVSDRQTDKREQPADKTSGSRRMQIVEDDSSDDDEKDEKHDFTPNVPKQKGFIEVLED